jgi:2-polyprenyl-6-methoxyphenol hydroxylase-like FAD-dependent oxidoreductase
MSIDYIIVGGGPVGLLTALLLNNNQKRVLVFEKREVYNRSQHVFINLKKEYLSFKILLKI